MRLCDALGVQRGAVVSFVGAGGKTSALLRLGNELRAEGWRVLATTTTRIAAEELAVFPAASDKTSSPRELSDLMTRYGMIFLYAHLWGSKVIGLQPEMISKLADSLDSDVILIEADGSRRAPLKAPKEHEPVIPPDSTLVVPVAGMNAVGQPFNEKYVYNLEKIVERYGFVPNNPIQPAWIAQVVRDETLGLRRVPESARVVALLNRAGRSVRERLKARRTAQMILQQNRVQAVAIGSVQEEPEPIWEVQRRTAAIVLAAGLSSRMGQPKPLLKWGGQTVIETIVRRLLPLRFADVVVVTGHQADQVKAVLKDLEVRTVYNKNYASGEMLSSLQVGLKALDPSIAACLVFLSDQPQINPRLINDVLIAYAEGRGTIVAPSFNHRRGHPILIDRRYWRELLELPNGRAPRDVINAYPSETAYVLTHDENILTDMDTPEQYQAALKRAGLL